MAYSIRPQQFEYQDIILTSTKFRLPHHSNNCTLTLRRLTEYIMTTKLHELIDRCK